MLLDTDRISTSWDKHYLCEIRSKRVLLAFEINYLLVKKKYSNSD